MLVTEAVHVTVTLCFLGRSETFLSVVVDISSVNGTVHVVLYVV